MSLVVKSALVPSMSMVFEAETSCGFGRYVWSYFRRGGSPLFLCNGSFPVAACSGSVLETHPNAFFSNDTITIRVEFILDDENKKRQEVLGNPLAEVTVDFEASDVSSYLFYGLQDQSLFLEASFTNENYYETTEYLWGCAPRNPSECPACPSSDIPDENGITYYSSGSISNYTIEFEDEFDTDCPYDLSVLITFLPAQSNTTASRVATIPSGTGTGDGPVAIIPIIRFDDVTSSCVSEENDGEIYLAVQPVEGLPDGYEVVDYVWDQTAGGVVECVETSDRNCGGNGNAFIYFTKESTIPCTLYSWDVSVVIGNDFDSSTSRVSLPFCEMSFLDSPKNGLCYLANDRMDSDGCNVSPLQYATIICEGWEVDCTGDSSLLTAQIFRVSDSDVDSLIPLGNPSIEMTNSFLVPDEDFEVRVRLCNAAVCTTTDPISIRVCEESEEEREEIIETVLSTVEDIIREDELETALQTLLAVGDSLSECEDYFDELIRLTNEYVAASLISVEGNGANLGDTTALMELLGVIGANSCTAPTDLFDSLLVLCSAPTSADVQSYALDELLQAVMDNAKTDEERIEALDFAIRVNECVQATTLSDRCNDRLATLYQGDSFFFAQYIFTMEQFRTESIAIDIPKAQVIFPKGFDEQIARDYTLATGDSVVRFSCVAINLARTDTILSTETPIDSAIIGLTAMVYVNGSAWTIELGHQGEPVTDVILRIFRQEVRDQDEKKREEGELISKRMENFSRRKGRNYSNRYSLADDCDEEINCSYYEGEGLLSTAGCVTVDVTDEYVDCSCDHYSNFGLLFSSCSSGDWTIWRILSLALLGSFWIILFTLMLLVSFCPTFRIWARFETMAEKRTRVLGSAEQPTTMRR